MPIPEFDVDGLLPVGVHNCTLTEIGTRFGAFRNMDRRPELFRKLKDYLEEVRKTSLVRAAVIDGSFVTSNPSPNDIDMIIVLGGDHDFSVELRPFQSNPLSWRWVNRNYSIDILVAREASVEFAEYLAFFKQVRNKPEQTKGLLRLTL